MSEALPQPILQARIRLMLQEPYLASAIARFPLINAAESDWCETMATTPMLMRPQPVALRSSVSRGQAKSTPKSKRSGQSRAT